MTNKSVRLDLLSKVPLDVIINHIIPFTYSVQPYSILVDIRSHFRDKQLLENLFYIEYNPYILAHELIRFSNKDVIPVYYIHANYSSILKRNFMLSNKKRVDLCCFVFHKLHIQLYKNPERIINFLWGLLTLNERTEFLNVHLPD